MLTHIEGVASECYSYPATMLAGVFECEDYYKVKLKIIDVGTTKFCLSVWLLSLVNVLSCLPINSLKPVKHMHSNYKQ